MASTFGTLEIAKSGMMTYNAALQTTSHNIANVETKGYSRQTTNIQSLVGNKSSSAVQGFGVTVSEISRERNEYYDTKYQATCSTYNEYNTEAYYLNQLQDYVCGNINSDKDSSIANAFDIFCGTLSNLVGDPSNITIRSELVTQAQTFTEFINNVSDGLQKLQTEANQEIKSVVEQINSYAEKIASINEQINIIESYGNTANDLRDARSVLIDELSQYCAVESKEIMPADGVGIPQFYVYLNGSVLVNGYDVNAIELVQKDTYSNINDIEGCYELKWSDGTDFKENSNILGGKLQALFDIRDGNNSTTLEGKASNLSTNADGKVVITMTGNINDARILNIPAYDGELTINNRTFVYESFSVETDEEGNYTYKFTMKDPNLNEDSITLQNALTKGYNIVAGSKVDYKGIPYYMAQLNEFVRTYAEEFNRVHNGGADLNGNAGLDFFNGKVAATGANFDLSESVDGKDIGFSSIPVENEDGSYTGSYYYLTASNFTISQKIIDDPKLVAGKEILSEGLSVGNSNGVNIQKLSELKEKADMFVHGAPDSFIQSLTATLGVGAQKAQSMSESQSNLMYAIDTNRISVSGVDEDEEASDLMTYQNMLLNQYKVLSVLNEVLDKLINGTV